MLDYKMAPMTKKDATFYWYNMREKDKQETEIFGFTRKSFVSIPRAYTGASWSLSVRIDDGYKRICCGGYHTAPLTGTVFANSPDNALVFWFLCTDSIKDYWTLVTKVCSKYIRDQHEQLEYMSYIKLAYIWDGHEDSLKWSRLLGFKHHMGVVKIGEHRILMMRL